MYFYIKKILKVFPFISISNAYTSHLKLFVKLFKAFSGCLFSAFKVVNVVVWAKKSFVFWSDRYSENEKIQ